MSKATQSAAAVLIGSWSTPVRITGNTGPALFNLQVRVNRPIGPDAILKRAALPPGTDAYSIESYPAARVSFRAGTSGTYMMCGLNSDPATDQSYSSIDFAWYMQANGTTSIYESAVLVGTAGGFGAFTTSTQFAIDYDGAVVRYYKDNTLARAVRSPARSSTSTRASTPGGAISNIIIAPAAPRAKAGESPVARYVGRRIVRLYRDRPISGVVLSNPSEQAIVLGGTGGARSIPTVKPLRFWECRPDGGNDASGGFVDQLDLYGVDHEAAAHGMLVSLERCSASQ